MNTAYASRAVVCSETCIYVSSNDHPRYQYYVDLQILYKGSSFYLDSVYADSLYMSP